MWVQVEAMRNKVKRIMAYVYMPFLYMFLGYLLIYFVAAPSITMLSTSLMILLPQESLEKSSEIKIVDQPEDEAVSVQSPNILNSSTEESTDVSSNEKNEKAQTVNISDLIFPDLGERYANLCCKRIALEAPVYWGDTKEILKDGVGQYIGSFLPGFERTILLSGHNNSYFHSLQKIETGDLLSCTTSYGEYEYVVTSVTIMSSADAEDSFDRMLSSEKEKLILYTCYPFDSLIAEKEDRLFVFADKISGPRIQ